MNAVVCCQGMYGCEYAGMQYICLFNLSMTWLLIRKTIRVFSSSQTEVICILLVISIYIYIYTHIHNTKAHDVANDSSKLISHLIGHMV